MIKTYEEYKKTIDDFFGIKEGDIIKIIDGNKELIGVYNGSFIDCRNDGIVYLSYLYNKEYTVNQVKTIGDTKCSDYEDCSFCPLKRFNWMDCKGDTKDTLYETIEKTWSDDPQIYAILKERLNKEAK